jgi:hypothetical protein
MARITAPDIEISKDALSQAASKARDVVEQASAKARTGVEKAAARLPQLSGRQKATVAVGVAAAAAAAGVSLALLKRRSSSRSRNVFRIEPDETGWRLTNGESSQTQTFTTKSAALQAARELAQLNAPCELVVHRSDGSEQDRHRYGVD